jgi:PAS domain S-box-containing protein
VAGEPKEKPAGEEGAAREAAERGSFARGERERLLERERAARAEAERARQETRAILESISDGFFALDREWRFAYLNREAERFWGRPREELLGKDIREVFPRATGNEGFRAIERVAKEGVASGFEAASSVVPGAWVAGWVYPSAEGLSVYFRDVTERKQAEEERARISAIVESSDDVIIGKTLEGIITSWNKGAERIYGYSAEEAVGQPISMLVPPDRPNEIPHILERIRLGEKVDHFETVRLAKDGRRLNISLTVSPIRNSAGDIVGASTIARDITERKRTEEKLRESEERLRRAIGIETVGVIFFKADGSITDSNDAFLRMSGYSRGDLEQGKVRWDVMTPPEWMAHSLKAIEEFESTGRTKPYEKEYVRKDGSRWWGLFAATRLDGEEGVEFIIDVTERKRAEEERERLLAQEWKARAQDEERKRISRELHDRVAHAMGVAHQSLELHDALKRSDPEAARAKMALAKETTVEAMSLTRNLAQELRGAEAQGSLSAALSGLLEAAVPPGVERALSVEGDEALVPPHVREQLYVILREGVRNAVSHSGASRVEVGVRVSPGEVVGYVEDDGRGFVEEDGGYAGGGTRSMRERAELLGGTFELSSGPGVGTAIRASIPLKTGSGNGAYSDIHNN